MMQGMLREKSDRGSITIEAAIALPVFICVVVSVVFFIRVVYVQELVRRSAAEAAGEIASMSYLAHKSGLEDNLYEWMVNGFGEGLAGKRGDNNSKEDGLLETIKNAILGKAAEEITNHMMMPLARIMSKRHLSGPPEGETDYLERLGILDGYGGLDFSGSSFHMDGTDDINIVIRYKVRIPVPLRIFGDFNFEERACARAWMEGDNPEVEEEDIWVLSNLSRGKKLWEIFHGNLPFTTPGITSFRNGCAIAVRSIDTTAASYQNPGEVENTAKGYMEDLAGFNGLNVFLEGEQIVITPDEIHSRRLILVIPRNTLPEGTHEALERCRAYAAQAGVLYQVRQYGYKNVED